MNGTDVSEPKSVPGSGRTLSCPGRSKTMCIWLWCYMEIFLGLLWVLLFRTSLSILAFWKHNEQLVLPPHPLWVWASVVRPAVLRGTSSPTALEMPTGLSACCTAKLQIIDWDPVEGSECVGFLWLCIPAVWKCQKLINFVKRNWRQKKN